MIRPSIACALALIAATPCRADTLRTADGAAYQEVVITGVNAARVRIVHAAGAAGVRLDNITAAERERLGLQYDGAAAQAFLDAESARAHATRARVERLLAEHPAASVAVERDGDPIRVTQTSGARLDHGDLVIGERHEVVAPGYRFHVSRQSVPVDLERLMENHREALRASLILQAYTRSRAPFR